MNKKIPEICIIAGSDSIGGAGLQADLRIAALLDCSASNVVTCITAQDLKGVHAIHYLDGSMVSAQLACALSGKPQAIKIGMLGSSEIISAIWNTLKISKIPIVLDPVLIATSKFSLTKDGAFSVLLEKLIPLSYLITPNLFEAEMISGEKIYSTDTMKVAAGKILALGARNVLIKGFHCGEDSLLDLLMTEDQRFVEFRYDKIKVETTHGTGCRLSSAIACYTAIGKSLEESITLASSLVSKEILRMLSLYQSSQ
ncbi:phosphomethylpyrimidine kinase [Neorickettsia helminthoeca str. Oregon]|uniref:hydroxymethylpyrimidine kinase n=1 Tax=Neorickettsia helminthoeca str. Oregon TaxID=1286528 RepID=X5H562_9RICK|nr:bifunctional hydroxymethylpyrimidine kinase/phosphomethylpyrimidine kinase [Neorickettsia helminthoeca]AHX11828.1 phosphomethylpyrimidine kinase [Neorickettsia helminthoeca str. Oregon]